MMEKNKSEGIETKERFMSLMNEIFRVDDSQLDYGIYRIMNYKRKEIRKFIEEDLLNQIKKIIDTRLSSSKLATSNEKANQIGTDCHIEALNHMISFFSRYYDEGDFVPQSRYSQGGQYYVSYTGDEVMFYWANQDQYYVKSGNSFLDYRFKIGEHEYCFKLKEDESAIEISNNKIAVERYYIFEDEVGSENNKTQIWFSYRGLTEFEKNKVEETIGKTLNQTNTNKLSIERMKNNPKINQNQQLWKEHVIIRDGKLENRRDGKQSELEWHLSKFTSKNTSDYFIHKNLKAFLSKERENFIKNNILDFDKVFDEEKYFRTQVTIEIFKEITDKLIEFLNQIETFQKELWEKPKLVINTDYLISLELVPEELLKTVLDNEKQMEQWRNMGIDTKSIDIKTNPTLSIDTALFDDQFKMRLLSKIENLDEMITGILINSDNFHALNLLKNKFRNRIKVSYIDPPYNTGGSEFIYKNKFQHSSWLTMMANRLSFLPALLTEDGVLTVAIDDFELNNLGKLLNKQFGEESFQGLLAIEIKPSGRTNDKFFSTSHEYAYFYSPNTDEVQINFFQLTEDQKKQFKHSDESGNYKWRDFLRTGGTSTPEERPNSYYPIYYNEKTKEIEVEPKKGWIEIFPIDSKNNKRVWRKTKPSLMEHVKLNEIQVVKNSKGEYKVRIKDMEKEGIRPKSFWYGARYDASSHGTKLLKNIIPTNNFSFPKSIFTVKDCIKLTCEEDSYILDFFAGSGTTGHATLQINAEDGGNRKFILVEMGNYFEDILKQRIQKVIYTENWCDGKPIDNKGYRKQIIKYHTLEQYEDSLENIEFTQKPKLKFEISDYLVRYSINFESKDTPILINFDTLKNPFNYQIKILTETGAKLVKVDLIETFNYLHAIEVKSIKFKEYENRFYQFIIGIRKNKQILVVWRDYSDSVDGKTGKHSKFDPVRDREIIQTEIINKNGKGIMEFDEIYVNGNCLIENFIPIESIFKKHFNSKNEGW